MDYTNSEEILQPDTDQEETPLDKILEQVNIAEHLDSELLDEMGQIVYDGYKQDWQSREAWDKQVDEWVKLAAQVSDQKSFPWIKSSNVKYPLLAIAAMQFAARAYPSLVPADGKIVQFRVVGADKDGMKAAKADKLAKHMNYQLLEDMLDWEEEQDRLLMQLPIVGCLFKKTYFDPIRKRNISRLVGPKDLVVNYWATSLEEAHRKTEVIPMTKNRLKSMQTAGLYLEIKDMPEPKLQPEVPVKSDVHGNQPPSQVDATTPYVILEQHTFWDIDDDGYQEPYIITIEEQTKKVLRVVARFDSDGIHQNEDNKVILIDPVEYYTKYGFVPNPDGGFYDIGFGHLLGPLNDSINTIINQLIDAGTLSNLQAGFVGKGLRLKIGETKFTPGEWKQVNATGDDIKKQIFPLPVTPPSDVLFKLLGMLVESGKELASVAEIFTGKMPGQNTPATTTQASIEQGMKVFTAIYKRTYRSLTKEFKKIFRLNSLYDENFVKAQLILDEPITKEDYDLRSYDVCPTADPTAISTTQKLLKAQGILELLPLGTINVMEATSRMLEAQEQPNREKLMQEPQPQVDPKVQAAQMKMQGEAQKQKFEQESHQQEMMKTQWETQIDMKMKQFEQKMDQMDKLMELQMKQMEANLDMKKANREHMQSLVQGNQQHRMKLQQMREQGDEKRKQRAMDRVEEPSRHGSSKGGSKSKDRRS